MVAVKQKKATAAYIWFQLRVFILTTSSENVVDGSFVLPCNSFLFLLSGLTCRDRKYEGKDQNKLCANLNFEDL